MTGGLGLVIGKFLPPHAGHSLLMNAALAASDGVVVIVCERSDDDIPGALRARWIEELHPAARVIVVDDHYDPHDSRLWAENTKRWLGRCPDTVFTSESYGEAFAAHLGARHVCVDRHRRTVPTSGTAVRSDPFANWEWISPPVRGWFALRVCILGAESTGTTTLAADLAAALSTIWVAEYGREYSARKFAASDGHWTTSEFVHIAAEQTRREDEAARLCNRILVCDTNAFATAIWHRRYVGHVSDEVESVARRCKPHLYILTGDEIPFVQDGTRDGEHVRHEMHRWFTEALARQPVPSLLVRGPRADRTNACVAAVRQLLVNSKWKPAPDVRHPPASPVI